MSIWKFEIYISGSNFKLDIWHIFDTSQKCQKLNMWNSVYHFSLDGFYFCHVVSYDAYATLCNFQVLSDRPHSPC